MAEPPFETIRLHQANERTMLAWVRTGIALMAFGFAIARFGLFLRQIAVVSPTVATPKGLESGWLGGALVALGTLANLTATLRFARTRRAIERGDVGAPDATAVYVVGGAATIVGLGMALLLARALAE